MELKLEQWGTSIGIYTASYTALCVLLATLRVLSVSHRCRMWRVRGVRVPPLFGVAGYSTPHFSGTHSIIFEISCAEWCIFSHFQRFSFPNMVQNTPFCTENFKNFLRPAPQVLFFTPQFSDESYAPAVRLGSYLENKRRIKKTKMMWTFL